MSEKPIILALFANNNEEKFLRGLEEEAERIKACWRPLKSVVEVICENYTDRKKLTECLDEYRERLIGLHFGGHADGEKLIFEDGAVSNESIVYKIKNEVKHLQFVFLNGCSTEGHVERLIVECKINFVISTRSSIDDDIAKNFAGWFYQNLYNEKETEDGFRYEKRSLQAAYQSALGSLKINFPDQNWDDCIEIINTQRGLGRPPIDNPWKLYITDIYKEALPWWVIANLKLTNAPHDKNYFKIFCIHRDTPELIEYYKELTSKIEDEKELPILINSIKDVSAVFNIDGVISEVKNADLLLLILDDSSQFKPFWKECKFDDSYKNKNVIFVNIKYNEEIHDFLEQDYTLKPNYQIPGIFFKTIKDFNQNSIPEEVSNIIYAEFKEELKKITKKIPDGIRKIDLKKQEEIFEDQWPKHEHQKVKLLLIEGSEKCGQLTLIRRILDCGIVEENYQKHQISLKISGIDTAYKLYDELKRKFSFDKDAQDICELLLRKEEEVVIIFDSVVTGNFDAQVVVRDFWTKLNEYAKTISPKNKLVIFVISRGYDFMQKDKRTLTDFIGSEPCAVIDLEPIVQIQDFHWKQWRRDIQSLLRKNEKEINEFQCPISLPAYFQEVVLETGKVLQVPSSFIIDNI